MSKLLKNYVYKNLKEHGNTIISEKTYHKLGEATIINHLKEQGLNTKININQHFIQNDNRTFQTNTTIVIEVIRDGKEAG